MGFKQEAGIPKGRIVPMYLTDEGDLFPIFFKSMEELEMCGEMIGMVCLLYTSPSPRDRG